MSREIRMVPPCWQHPTEWCKDWRTGRPILRHKPLFDGDYAKRAAEWDEAAAQWDAGFVEDYSTYPIKAWTPKDADLTGSYAEYSEERPKQEDYMPTFAEGEATHLMMYETTSEGTPISPAFATPEELARWLTDNNASAFGDEGASYEGWLRVAKGGYAPSMIMDKDGMKSGVDGLTDTPSTPAS